MMLMGNCINNNTSADNYTDTYATHHIGPRWPLKPTKSFQSRLESISQKGEFTLEEIQSIYNGIDKHDYTRLGRQYKRYRDLEQIINDLRQTKIKNRNRKLKTVKRTHVESAFVPPMVFYGFDFFDPVEH